MFNAKENGLIYYLWNKINNPRIIDLKAFENSNESNLVKNIHDQEKYYHLSCIDNAIFYASVDYFKTLWSHWCNLPLTTLMISSPWEVYAGKVLDYTTDALPIEIQNWFWEDRRIFLAESSQFYLEIHLLIKHINSAYSIYNSFRKEKSDCTHLSEFQHIEFEGKMNLNWCKKVFLWLFQFIFDYLFKNNLRDLLFFIDESALEHKKRMVDRWPTTVDFKTALDLLYKDTKDNKYNEFTLKHFWSREEIRLTEILWSNVIVEKFPMLQIPFYHAIADEENNKIPLAKNADFILYWYREVIGAGERIQNKDALIHKAEIFNLPKEDYMPYVQSRDFDDYIWTSGFWMWWQRFVHRITDQPTIYESTIIPRTHLTPNP